MLEVLMLTPEEVLYEGKAGKVILPGEMGVFEILEHHKRLVSRLFTGDLSIDRVTYPIRRGVVTVTKDKVTIIVETLSDK